MRFIHEKILRLRGMMKLGVMCCHADMINYLYPEKSRSRWRKRL